jgi:CheY-like chemotaxis protein
MKIMVVDDHQPILDLIRISIEGPEYEVRPYSDSRDAAAALQSEPFDGVFADVTMPHLDGYGLTRAVRGSPVNGRIPVVLITGANNLSTMQKAFEAGVTGFLGKPFGPKEVLGLLRAMRGPMLRERRRHARLPFCAALACRLEERAGPQFDAVSINLSDGGILLQSAISLEVGQRFSPQFSLPDGTEIRDAHALVIRKTPAFHVAAVFVSVLKEDRQAIQNFIMSQVPGSFHFGTTK